MDVPQPDDDEDQGADLSLDTADDDIRRELGRKKHGESDNPTVLDRIVGAVREMRKLKKRHTAPHKTHMEPFAERQRRQRLLPREVDVSLEKAIVRPVLCAMNVPDGLRLAKVLRAVRELLWSDDDIWGLWWHRDFKDVRHDLPATEWLPSWIQDNIWIQALPDQNAPALLSRLAKMPWRRWYQWSTFFRRSALWHIASMQNKLATEWAHGRQPIENYSDEEEEDEAYRPTNIRPNSTPLYLEVPAFDHDTGVGRGLVLVDENNMEDVYFPEELYEYEHEPTTEPDATSAVVVNARSPVYWLCVYIASDFALGLTRTPEARWDQLLDERKLSEEFSLGGTGMLLGNKGQNFDYKKLMKLYCSWYASTIEPGDGVVPGFFANFAPLRLEYARFHALERQLELRRQMARALPPFPAIDGVWFVGQAIQSTAQISAPLSSSLLCVGCNTQAGHKIRCKHCGQGYCGQACHERNWRRNCTGCVKGHGK